MFWINYQSAYSEIKKVEFAQRWMVTNIHKTAKLGGGVSRMRIVDTKKHAGRIKSSINCPCCVFPIKQSWKPGFDGIKGVELIYVL